MTRQEGTIGLILALLLTLCAAAAAIAGCGGGGAGDGDGFPSVDGSTLTPDDKAFITDFCAAVVPCCMTNGVTHDATVCKQSMAKVSMSRDPEVRAACLDQIRELSTMRSCMPDFGDLRGPCARLFDEPSGTRAPGELCATAAECMGSPGTITQCFQTCITYSLGVAGDYPCLGNVYSVGLINDIPWKAGSNTPESHGFLCEQRAGLYCDWNDNFCKPLQPGGGACGGGNNLACESHYCGGPTGGVCEPLPGLGEPCTLDCAGDTYCNEGVCVPKLAAGAACVGANDCSGDCKGSDFCSGTCLTTGVCSPLTLAQSLLVGVWCGATPLRD